MRIQFTRIGTARWAGKWRAAWFALYLLLFAGVGLVFGQEGQQLRGRVTDPTGAVVPDATVTATNQATTVKYPTQTTSSGDWVLPYLPPGTYTVTVEKNGFKSQMVKDIALSTSQKRTVDASLQLGEVSSSVTVTANPVEVATADADVIGTQTGEIIANVPQNYRNVMAATITVVGAGSKNGLYTQFPWGNISSGIVFNSSAGSLNIDGVNNMSTGFQTMAYIPLVDAVQETVVTMTPYDAGAVGFATAGNIDVHLKSGTNKFHGDVYDYYRSTGFDANTYQNKYYLATQSASSAYLYSRPKHQSQQFGFEADGPLVIPHFYNGHDKTFFTIAMEVFNMTRPYSSNPTYSVPGVLNQTSWFTNSSGYYNLNGLTQSNGNAITLYDPTTVGYGGNANQRQSFQSQGAPNSYSIPASRVNAAALAILKYYPAPNIQQPSAASVPWLNNYYAPTYIKSNYRNWLVKIDHNFSPQDRLTFRWGRWYEYETSTANGLPAGNPAGYGEYPYGQAFSDPFVEWVHTFSARMIFDIKASVNMDENHTSASLPFKQTALGLQDVSSGLTQPALLNYFPQINLSNTNAAANYLQLGSTGSSYSVHNQMSLLPSLTLVRGPHDIHIGMENREYQISTKQGSGGLAITANQYWTQQLNNNTSDAASGSSIASLMLDGGYLSGGSLTQPSQAFVSYHYWAAFLQDNWKVNSHLTLNMGVRYSFPAQAVERYDRFTNYFDSTMQNPITNEASKSVLVNGVTTTTTNTQANGYAQPIYGGLTFAGKNGVARTQIPRPWYFLEPRFGFSYKLDEKTVFHGGIGMAYNNDSAIYQGAQTGYSGSTPIVGSLTSNYTAAAGNSTLTNLFPSGYLPLAGSSLGALAGLGGSISYYNQQVKSGQTWSFSTGVQRQLTKGDLIDVQYVGKQFTHGPTGLNLNYPGAGWYAQCDVSKGGNASLCTASNTTNPFQNVYGFQGTSLFTAAKIQSGQLAYAYPQYTGVNENGAANWNGLWLNSLQMTETHRFNTSLTATTTYEYARIMDNNGIFDYSTTTPGAGLQKNLLRIEDGNDVNHRFTLVGTYKLPIGRGQQFFGNMNRLVDRVIGGWETSSMLVYESGRPWQPQCGGGNGQSLGGSTSCFYLPNGTAPMKVARKWVNEGGVRRLRGATPCVDTTNQTTGALINTAGYTSYGCTQANVIYKAAYAPAQNLVSTGIRLGANSEWDANLQKNFDLVESYKLTLKLDAFNVDNHPVWSNSYSTTQTDGTWGALTPGPTGQGNNPRYVQLSATIKW
ncbi:MAG: carboxypeptidase-like regulatory domain-containing protein [Terracidiphilus sp.]|nr:carboxypeptidase-like regulatory domain-containing protein [Terracidiphilus sp.]